MAMDRLAPLTLLAPLTASSSAGTGTSTPIVLTSVPKSGAFQLNVTIAPTTSGGTLDVYVQHSVDYIAAGPASSNFAATWDDFIHFNQVGGTVAAQIAGWQGESAPSSSLGLHTAAIASLAAGQVRNGPTGTAWRVQYVVTGGVLVASSSAYTFSVRANVNRN